METSVYVSWYHLFFGDTQVLCSLWIFCLALCPLLKVGYSLCWTLYCKVPVFMIGMCFRDWYFIITVSFVFCNSFWVQVSWIHTWCKYGQPPFLWHIYLYGMHFLGSGCLCSWVWSTSLILTFLSIKKHYVLLMRELNVLTFEVATNMEGLVAMLLSSVCLVTLLSLLTSAVFVICWYVFVVVVMTYWILSFVYFLWGCMCMCVHACMCDFEGV